MAEKNPCQKDNCLRACHTGYDYCASHRCHWSGGHCVNLAKQNAHYCPDHGCFAEIQKPGADSRDECLRGCHPNYEYCASHRCHWPGGTCLNLAKRNAQYCRDHVCSAEVWKPESLSGVPCDNVAKSNTKCLRHQSIDRVDTVFISSRSDELWLERNAAYEAIGHSGRTPLLIDASLNKLTDSDLPPGEPADDASHKRHSKGRTLRDQIDAFVDAADFFIGIYGVNSGRQNLSIHWMTWIEYELLRFLARHAGYAEDSSTESLNDFMRNRKNVTELRRDLLGTSGATQKIETLRCVLEQRCSFFFKRYPNTKLEPSIDLQRLLSFISPYVLEIRQMVSQVNDGGDFRFYPAHAMLFDHVREEFIADTGHSIDHKSGPWVIVEVERSTNGGDRVDDRRGVLYPLLRVLFQEGMEIRDLSLGDSNSEGHGIHCFAGPFGKRKTFEDADLTASRNNLDSRLKRDLKGLPVEYKVEVSQSNPRGNGSPGVSEKKQRPGHHYFELKLLNLPGILWNITTLVTSHRGSIVDMEFPFGNTGADNEVGLWLGFESSKEHTGHIRTFEHQLKLMHGVLSIQKRG